MKKYTLFRDTGAPSSDLGLQTHQPKQFAFTANWFSSEMRCGFIAKERVDIKGGNCIPERDIRFGYTLVSVDDWFMKGPHIIQDWYDIMDKTIMLCFLTAKFLRKVVSEHFHELGEYLLRLYAHHIFEKCCLRCSDHVSTQVLMWPQKMK